MAGLEALRSLDDRSIATRRAIGLINFTNEEGARFSPAMTGSSVLAGTLPLEAALSSVDSGGQRLGDLLAASGQAGEGLALPPGPVEMAFELHIEQGPVLEREGLPIGLVEGVFGISWHEIVFSGPGGHSGTVPCDARIDPVLGAARLVEAVACIGRKGGEGVRATVGRISAHPGSINSIAARAIVSAELRSPIGKELASLEMALKGAAKSIAASLGLGLSVKKTFHCDPAAFDKRALAVAEKAAKALGLGFRAMVSGAGHDAVNVSKLAPTAMIFIPCVGGRSHVPEESVPREWAENGANVLLLSLLFSASGAVMADQPFPAHGKPKPRPRPLSP
jgi:N-carbamoyl-L-amino-acid hydrolase